MRELVEASGVHRQTIHFYLRAGLLPPACAAGGTRNARYGRQHLALLCLIRELRDERGLSLEAIRRLFDHALFDADEVRRQLQGLAAPAGKLLDLEGERRVTLEDIRREAGVPLSFVHQLVEAGALASDPDDAEGRFDPNLVPAVAAARRLSEQGLDDMTLFRLMRLAGSLGALEAASLASDMTGEGDNTESLRRRAESRYVDLTDLMVAIRRGAIRRVLRRLVETTPRSLAFADDVIYSPSQLFIRRHRLDRELAQAEAAAQHESSSSAACQRLGRLLISLGRYGEAEQWLARSTELDPSRLETHSYLGVARAITGRVVAGVESCRRAVALGPGSSRAHAFLADALALQAASTTGLEDPTRVLRLALAEALLSRDLKAADSREHMETLLARGRLFTMLPRSIAGEVTGRRELEEILAHTEGRSDADNGFDFPGSNVLYRMHALYYLGVSALHGGDREQGLRWLRESITIDPPSRFAQHAYELIAGDGD